METERLIYNPNMSFKSFWRRELWVARYGQTARFRIFKWIVILLLAYALLRWQGPYVVAAVFFCMFMAGLSLHFLLSWKTERWTKSWGLYKRITLEDE